MFAMNFSRVPKMSKRERELVLFTNGNKTIWKSHRLTFGQLSSTHTKRNVILAKCQKRTLNRMPDTVNVDDVHDYVESEKKVSKFIEKWVKRRRTNGIFTIDRRKRKDGAHAVHSNYFKSTKCSTFWTVSTRARQSTLNNR